VNSAHVLFGPDGDCSDEQVAENLRTIGLQVVEFATARV
jgi:FMN reductase